MSSYAWGTWEGTAEGFLAEKWKQPRGAGRLTGCAGVGGRGVAAHKPGGGSGGVFVGFHLSTAADAGIIPAGRGCREALWDRRRAVRPSPEVGLILFVGFVGALILVTGGIDGDALVFVPLRVDAKLIVFSRQDGVQGNAGDSGDS